ncbi:DinB family protein [Pseudanabaena sp. 'Roaring Creek']|uniref:DinB family protein n=1 Tax=Pseudanabaena sp. 'Roaring Creek' TaxID=1681830 RepID=UPI0006D7CAEA|nr:DinB family protein [Pseudanabaena sp. 'Roaring Creek']
MINKTQFELMARYNQWMNSNLYEVCADIPDEDRKKDLGAFFESIHGTLNHLLYGDKAWMGRFTSNPFHCEVIGQQLYDNFEDLRQERIEVDRQILLWSMRLDSEWLSSKCEYKSNVDGKTRVIPSWVLVTHMFNHQTHHRGQLTTLINQLGYNYGTTDLPWLPEFN